MESVWDYPRPPALVSCERRVRVEIGGMVVADSTAALRVLETSHPPTIYLPPADVSPGTLVRGRGTSLCECKGRAADLDAVVDGERRRAVAWTYPDPVPAYAELRDHVAFHFEPGRRGLARR